MQIIKKYKNMNRTIKASLWYILCNFLQNGITFLVVPIYTRLLSEAEYGNYSVFNSWKDVLFIFATLNLSAGVFTKAMVELPEDRDNYTSAMLGLNTVISVIFIAIVELFGSFIKPVIGISNPLLHLMYLYFMFSPAFLFWSVRQRVEYEYRRPVIVTILVSGLTPIISLLILSFTNLRENSLILGFLSVQIVTGVFFFIIALTKSVRLFNKEYWSYAIKYNIPLIPHYLSLIVLNQADRIMIKGICGSDAAGLYSLASQISMVMTVLIGAINSTFVPWSYERLKNKEYKKLNSATMSLNVLVGGLSLIIITLAPEIILFLGTSKYLSAIYVVPSIAIGVYYTFVYNLFSRIEFYYSKTKYVMLASLVCSVINVGLNAIFIPIYGFVAAGYTTAVSYLALAIAHGLFAIRICKSENIGTNVYSYKYYILSVIVLTVMSNVLLLTYSNTVLRYLVTGLFIIVCLVKKNSIMAILDEIRK